jgi:hypothetical protein
VFVEGGWGGGGGISVGVTAARGGGNIYSTASVYVRLCTERI